MGSSSPVQMLPLHKSGKFCAPVCVHQPQRIVREPFRCSKAPKTTCVSLDAPFAEPASIHEYRLSEAEWKRWNIWVARSITPTEETFRFWI